MIVPTRSPRNAAARSSGSSPLMIWKRFTSRACSTNRAARSKGRVGRFRSRSSLTLISWMNGRRGVLGVAVVETVDVLDQGHRRAAEALSQKIATGVGAVWRDAADFRWMLPE